MVEWANYVVTAAILSFGVTVVGLSCRAERRRQREAMPSLVPTTPFMLFGLAVILAAIIYFLDQLDSPYSHHFIATALLLFGLIVCAIAVLIEHLRHRKAKGEAQGKAQDTTQGVSRPPLSATPFLFSGAITILVAINYFIAIWRK
jgi:cytochrome bd-type quinol oxidase subunit 2